MRALRDSVPNAFALPNGSVYVHSGLLALLENEDQLTSVLAHEAAHVLVIVMDAHTGDILFLSEVDAMPLSRDITVAGDDLEKPLSKSLKKLLVGQ